MPADKARQGQTGCYEVTTVSFAASHDLKPRFEWEPVRY
jgi:hypothetical protein